MHLAPPAGNSAEPPSTRSIREAGSAPSSPLCCCAIAHDSALTFCSLVLYTAAHSSLGMASALPSVAASGADAAQAAGPAALPLALDSLVSELESLRRELPSAILTSCQAADASFSEAQEQPQFIVVSGAAGAGEKHSNAWRVNK